MKRSLRFQIPLLVVVRVVLNTAIRMVYPFLPVFSRGLGVDYAVLARAVTVRSAAGVFGPFLASLADSRGRRAGMLFGILIFAGGAGLVAAWPSLLTFTLALVLTIVGNFVFVPSMQAYLGDRVPYTRRGLALSLTELGWSLSFMVGVPAAGLLIARFGWQAPFAVVGGLAGLAALVLFTVLPGLSGQSEAHPGFQRNLGKVLASRAAVAGLLLGLCMSGANELVNLIFGVWMEDAFGLKIAALGAASAVIGFSELGGELLVSGLSDRVGKARTVGAGLALSAAAAVALLGLGSSVTGALAGLFFFYISFEFTIVSSIPLMTEILPEARATLMAVWIATLSVGRALGDLAAPPLYRLGSAWPHLPALLPIVVVAVSLDLLAIGFLLRLHRGLQRELNQTGQAQE